MSCRFRPCIDLHGGKVKQIVGGTLRDDGSTPRENFVSENPPGWFAGKFREDALRGGHVIMLGKGNEDAAREALGSWPGGMHVGGGIHAGNASEWIDAGGFMKLRVAGCDGMEFAEGSDIILGNGVSGNMQPAVEEHRAVACGENEAIAVQPARGVGIEAHVFPKEDGTDLGAAKWESEVT